MYVNLPYLVLMNDAYLAEMAAKTASQMLAGDNATAFVSMHGRRIVC